MCSSAQQNRLEEALILFESISNSRWFLKTSIVRRVPHHVASSRPSSRSFLPSLPSQILFLNKIDLFQSKLKTVPLNRYFPD